MKKVRLICSILSIIFIVLNFFIGRSYIDGFLIAGAIVLFAIAVYLSDLNTFLKIFCVSFCLVTIYYMDYFGFTLLKNIPTIAKEYASSTNVSTYDSFIYRVYSCGDNSTMDFAYKKRYVCDEFDLRIIQVNDFLEDPQKSFEKYQGKFVKLSGKINKINLGNNSIEVEKYEKDENNQYNGYVKFNDVYAISTTFDSKTDLSDVHIYDEIAFIGRVKDIKIEGTKKTINIVDAIHLPSRAYEQYKIDVKTNNDSELIQVFENVYTKGIEEFLVSYSSVDVYELSYVLMDRRLSVLDLIYSNPEVEENTLEDHGKYKALICTNGAVVIGNKKLTNNEKNCPVIEKEVIEDEQEQESF